MGRRAFSDALIRWCVLQKFVYQMHALILFFATASAALFSLPVGRVDARVRFSRILLPFTPVVGAERNLRIGIDVRLRPPAERGCSGLFICGIF